MSQRLKAKFKVNSIFKQFENSTTLQLNLSAVYGTEGENKDFTSVTPWGNLTMGIEESAPAASILKVGDEVYMYLEKIE